MPILHEPRLPLPLRTHRSGRLRIPPKTRLPLPRQSEPRPQLHPRPSRNQPSHPPNPNASLLPLLEVFHNVDKQEINESRLPNTSTASQLLWLASSTENFMHKLDERASPCQIRHEGNESGRSSVVNTKKRWSVSAGQHALLGSPRHRLHPHPPRFPQIRLPSPRHARKLGALHRRRPRQYPRHHRTAEAEWNVSEIAESGKPGLWNTTRRSRPPYASSKDGLRKGFGKEGKQDKTHLPTRIRCGEYCVADIPPTSGDIRLYYPFQQPPSQNPCEDIDTPVPKALVPRIVKVILLRLCKNKTTFESVSRSRSGGGYNSLGSIVGVCL